MSRICHPLSVTLSGLFISCSLFFSLPVHAQPASTPSGSYIMEGGSGALDIKPMHALGNEMFNIETAGANGHTCSVNGQIRYGKAVLTEATDESGKPCIIVFRAKGNDSIEVSSPSEYACRYYCGARASFTALYIKPAPGCSPKEQRKTRNDFKRLYDKRDYAAAQATLEPLLKTCSRVLDQVNEGWIRNDLALTQYKQGDSAGCLRTLQPMAEMVSNVDQGVIGFEPADAPTYASLIKASRTNLKLCRGR